MRTRDYTTWESDLGSDREEFHGYSDEIVAYIEPQSDKTWAIFDPLGAKIAERKTKVEVQAIAHRMVEESKS